MPRMCNRTLAWVVQTMNSAVNNKLDKSLYSVDKYLSSGKR